MAIIYSKYNKTLKFKRLYYKQIILSIRDPNYYNFKLKFDLINIIQQITKIRSYQTIINYNDIDDYESLTYKQIINKLYIKQ